MITSVKHTLQFAAQTSLRVVPLESLLPALSHPKLSLFDMGFFRTLRNPLKIHMLEPITELFMTEEKLARQEAVLNISTYFPSRVLEAICGISNDRAQCPSSSTR